MNTLRTRLHLVLAVAALCLATSVAQAGTLESLKGEGLDQIYGTYGPRGNCNAEPIVVVDDSGFTFRYRGSNTHPKEFEYMASFYTGAHGEPTPEEAAKRVIALFGMNDPTGATGYFDVNTHLLVIESNAARGQRVSSLKAALVRGSPYAKCGTHITTPHPAAAPASAYPVKLNFGADAPKPSTAQAAAILHAAASDIRDFNHPEHPAYALALADLNDDGHPDLLVQYGDGAFCGSAGCSGVIVMATAHGYSSHAIGLPNFYGRIDVLADKHHGMHDLRFGDSPIWQWTGRDYTVTKAARSTAGSQASATPGNRAPTRTASGARGWQTRDAAGRTLAMATPIDSVIKTVSVFCNEGKPVLAMLVKARPPAGPVTMTWVFRGWTVNVPMAQGNRDATLWMADLSGSDLPQWLAHRGKTRTTRELAHLATESFLRINGGMQGEVSLKDSTHATQAALGRCYRY